MSRRPGPRLLPTACIAAALSACGVTEEGGALFGGDSGVGGMAGGGGVPSTGGASAGGVGGTSGSGGSTGGSAGSAGAGGAGGGAGTAGTGGSMGGAAGASGGSGGASGGSGGATGGSGGASGGSGGATGGSGGATGGSGGATGGSGGATGGSGGATGGSGGASGGSGGAGGTGGAGGSGGTNANPCMGLCTDANATCSSGGSCLCNAGFINVDSDADPRTATCISSIVLGVKVKVALSHEDCGHLTIKLRGPNATVITLVSRPGVNEGADDGGGLGPGDLTGYDEAYPVTFDDAAAVAGESMGGPVGPFAYVCKDDNICAYKPDKGSAAGPTSLKGAFQTVDAVGKWTLCVGDSNWLVGGSLEQWEISFTTSGGTLTRSTPASLGLGIKDDAYDGTLASMTCRDLQVM